MSAADRIDELKKRYDENPRRFFASLANEYRKGGDLDQAISLCETHLAEQPGNMNGHVVYGQALFEAGRYDDSKKTFETALTLDPENLIALRHLGDIACTNGANDEAKVWYERVLDADPRNDEIIALLAHLANEAKTAHIKGPISSVESMAPREARGEPFKAPQVITPLSTTAQPVAIESVDTQQIPAMPVTPVNPVTPVSSVTPVAATPVAPPPRPSIGLIDIGDDFDTSLQSPAATEAPAEEFPSFADLNFGTQPADIAPLPASPADDLIMMDPFADPAANEMKEWNPAEPQAAEPQTAEPQAAEDLLFGDTQPAVPAPPFVTETMAELYLQQGFTDEALDVYRQLSAQFPDDENLKERVAKLERGDRSSLSLEVVSDHGTEEVEPQGTLEGAVPLGAYLSDEPAPIAAIARGVRAYFAGLAARRAVRPDRRESTPGPPATSIGSLDSLFSGAISQEDEHVALAFAQVAGAVEMGRAAVKGKPTAPAETELSLDSVFHEADSRSTATVTRQSQTLRFDQFFSTTDESSDPSPPQQRAAAPVGEPGSPAELKQFQSWLTGLKKP